MGNSIRARRRAPSAGVVLLEVIAGANGLGAELLARCVEVDGVTGARCSETASPVGRWILARMRARGVDAHLYHWSPEGVFTVLDGAGRRIAQARVTGGALVELEEMVDRGDPAAAGLVS